LNVRDMVALRRAMDTGCAAPGGVKVAGKLAGTGKAAVPIWPVQSGLNTEG
jgi:hypothetical protein